MISTPCIFFTGVGRAEAGLTELPDPGPDDVVVETILSSISPGTELRCLAGEQEGLGRDHFPFVPGYSLVGRVARAGQRHRALEGTVVFSSGARRARHTMAWGGHIAAAVVPAESIVPVPAGIREEDAVLAKLAAIAHRGVSMARPEAGEAVVVVGLGAIGQMSARLFAIAGARVLGVDLAPARARLAERAGITTLVPEGPLGEAVRRRLPGGAPIVVDATGSPCLLRETMSLVRDKPWDESDTPGGRVVVQGSYPGDITLPSSTPFAREMTMLWPRDSQRRDIERVFELLGDGRLRFDGILGSVHPPAEAQAVYDQLRSRDGALVTAAFRWRRAAT